MYIGFGIPNSVIVEDEIVKFHPDFYRIGNIVYAMNTAGSFDLHMFKRTP